MDNAKTQSATMNNKNRTSAATPDKNKHPDKSREANKENPDSTKGKSGGCAC